MHNIMQFPLANFIMVIKFILRPKKGMQIPASIPTSFVSFWKVLEFSQKYGYEYMLSEVRAYLYVSINSADVPGDWQEWRILQGTQWSKTWSLIHCSEESAYLLGWLRENKKFEEVLKLVYVARNRRTSA